MTNPNLTLLEAAVRLLEPLLDELVFIGGCATGLLITDPAAEGIRPTYDVDAITEVASYGQYADLSERLRALNLQEDRTEGAPTCRWRYQDLHQGSQQRLPLLRDRLTAIAKGRL